MSFRRLVTIAKKEFYHVIRDWRSLVLSILIPLVLIFIFGYALTFDLKDTPVTVWDQSRSPESRELLSYFEGSRYFEIISYEDRYEDLANKIDKSQAMLALIIPSTFSEDLQDDNPATVQVIGDGSDSNTLRLALGYVNGISMLYNQKMNVSQAMPRKVDLSFRVFYNSELRSENAIVPGLIAVVMVIIASMLTSVTVAKEWEKGSMVQLISTPMRKMEFILGKICPYFVIGILDVIIAILLSTYLFDVPLRGSLPLLFLGSSIFLVGTLLYGLMVSISFKTQVLANQVAIMASYLPSILLSGWVFTIDNMPKFIQVITYIVPAKYFIEILRGIYLKDVGIKILWVNFALLFLYLLIMLFVAYKRLKLKKE